MGPPERVCLGEPVRQARETGQALVALETAVVTHGLPAPANLAALAAMQREIEAQGAVPAVCLVRGGRLWVGADAALVQEVAVDPRREKAAVRDLGWALLRGVPAGLTVSATLLAAALTGIRVFATGGIGGVHRNAAESGDVSADLQQLARSPVVVVCAGAKSVLDIPRTLEYLETMGVPVFAYRTRRFPAFYLASSGAEVPEVKTAAEIAETARLQWELGYPAGLVVGNPIPTEEAVAAEEWEEWLTAAEAEAARQRIRGKEVTPFLLGAVAEHSHGRTVRANIALLRHNARLAAEIAVHFYSGSSAEPQPSARSPGQ